MPEDQTFVCGGCEALSQQRNAPPRTPWNDCTRCGDPTRTYIGAVIDGRVLLTTASEFDEIARAAKTDVPGERIIGGHTLYSAAWL